MRGERRKVRKKREKMNEEREVKRQAIGSRRGEGRMKRKERGRDCFIHFI